MDVKDQPWKLMINGTISVPMDGWGFGTYSLLLESLVT